MRLQHLLNRMRHAWNGMPGQAGAVRSPTARRNPAANSAKVPLRAAPKRRVVLGGLAMGMMIAIGLAVSQTAQASSTATGSWAITVSPLAYDKAIYDSGAVLGLDSATIPLSGTTDAPDGVEIEARAVRFDDAADTPTGAATPWAAIGTAAGGAWQGNLPVPRAPGTWSRAEVRVKGSTAPAAQMTERFDAGHVWALYEQSNWARAFLIQESLAPVAVLDPEAVQTFCVDRTTGIAARTLVTDANTVSGPTNPFPITSAVVALANAFIAERPGEKLAIAAHLQSGTSPFEMITEPQSASPRKWDHEKAINELITAAGQKVGLVLDMGWVSWGTSSSNAARILPILTGKEIDGTVRNPGDTTNDGYVLSHDLREFYDYSYTRLTFCGAHGKGVTGTKSNWLGGNDQAYEAMIDVWRGVMSDTANFPEMLYCPMTNDGALRGEDDGAGGWSDTVHHHGNVDWGVNRLARLGMMNALKTAGMVAWPVPAFDRVHWAPDGTRATFWISDRDVTTERNRTGGASAYVRGWSLDGQIITTAQLVPNAGGSGRVGVEITCPAGYTATSPGAVAGRFTYASVIDYGKGELPGFQTYPDDYRNDYVLDLLVADAGAVGMAALPVRMRSAAPLGNTLSAPQAFVVDGSQYFTTTVGLAALGIVTPTQYSLDFVGSIDGSTGGDQRIAAMAGNGPVVNIGNAGAVKVTCGSSGTHQHSQSITWGQVITLSVQIDQLTLAVSITLNGVKETFTPASMSAIPTGQALSVLANSGGGNSLRGTIQSVAVRINDLVGVTTPLFLASGNGAAVTAAHGPTGTGWLRGTLS